MGDFFNLNKNPFSYDQLRKRRGSIFLHTIYCRQITDLLLATTKLFTIVKRRTNKLAE